jgi:hypothetical protein
VVIPTRTVWGCPTVATFADAAIALIAVTALAFSAPLAVTDDIKPKPNADTATSAMRLRSVFVDICFLSISQDQEFPELGFG